MGSTLTKLTTNNVELNESNVSDFVIYEQQVKKDKEKSSPVTEIQAKSGLFKSIFDPRSPSLFITRTPIQILRTVSTSKFNHQELNESLNESVDIDILTAEEQASLDSNKDLVDATLQDNEKNEAKSNEEEEPEKLPDPRSPSLDITRTPIIAIDEVKKTDNNLIKKIAEKLISTKISNEATENKQEQQQMQKLQKDLTKKKSKSTEKTLIFEDDENENNFNERFSTPPKKSGKELKEDERTPLGCMVNKTRNTNARSLLTSTPKGSKIPVLREKSSSSSTLSSRIPRRRIE